MKSYVVNAGIALAIGTGVAASGVFAQQAPLKRNFEAEINTALRAAKDASEFEFLGTLVRVCLLPQSGGEDTSDKPFGYVANPASAPARSTWYADPAKVFDNLYFVGGKVHSSWALTTKDGIILIDTLYPYNSEELIIGGMQKLGLDPRNIKYVLISHAHGDHIGGAEMMQTRYGARIVIGGPDWDLVAKYPNRYKTMAPKRDIVATEGMKITLGDATVLLSNHSEFDNAANKNRMLAGRGNGPHPYETGADWIQRYFQVMQSCARAAQIKLEQKAAETATR